MGGMNGSPKVGISSTYSGCFRQGAYILDVTNFTLLIDVGFFPRKKKKKYWKRRNSETSK